jgi:hypothetical protein
MKYATHERVTAYAPGEWNEFPTRVDCSHCGGNGYVNFERESASCPASSDPCEHCDDGTIYSPKTRLVRRYRIRKNPINLPLALGA